MEQQAAAGPGPSSIVPSFASTKLPFAPFCALWVPSSARLVALGCHQTSSRGPATGGLQVYKLEMPPDGGDDENGQLRLLLDASEHAGGGLGKAGLKCGTFNLSTPASGRHLAVGDFSGRVSVWDTERLASNKLPPSEAALVTIEAGQDSEIVNSIDAVPNLIVSGGRDGRACVWDVRQRGKPTAELALPESDCWTVTFAAQDGFFAGYDDGKVYLADLRMNAQPRWQHNLVRSSGICSLDHHNGKLLATTVDDDFTLFDFDLATATLKREVKGHPTLRPPEAKDATTWTARSSPHNRDYYMTASGNGYLDLYKASSAGGRSALQSVATAAAGTQPILSFDWNQAKEGLFAFASLDNSLHVGFVPTALR